MPPPAPPWKAVVVEPAVQVPDWQLSSTVQPLPSALQPVPLALLLPPAVQAPLEQVFAFTHWVAASHSTPLAAWLAWHVPLPLQVSGLVQMVSVELPHAVPCVA